MEKTIAPRDKPHSMLMRLKFRARTSNDWCWAIYYCHLFRTDPRTQWRLFSFMLFLFAICNSIFFAMELKWIHNFKKLMVLLNRCKIIDEFYKCIYARSKTDVYSNRVDFLCSFLSPKKKRNMCTHASLKALFNINSNENLSVGSLKLDWVWVLWCEKYPEVDEQ